MNCNQVRELLPDLAAGMTAATTDIESHIASCPACAAKLQGFRQTMTLLDEWRTPEPGPYFDTRMGAAIREEMHRPAAGWLHWLRRPAVAVSLAAVIVAGAVVVGNRATPAPVDDREMVVRVPGAGVPAEPGTAVGDLQALEKDHELFADFDVLDELQGQEGSTANP